MKRTIMVLIAVALLVLSIWCFVSTSPADQLSELVSGKSVGPTPIKIARGADAADIVLTPKHELIRVEHKNAHGQLPLEIVQTIEGPISIQRTFKTDGTLVKEEAFRDGKPVPLPPTASRAGTTVK